jgi:uncharacterized membrane protein
MNRFLRVLLITGMCAFLTARSVGAQDATVKSVLFYNPACGACKEVINKILPPILKQYGNNLLVFTIDVTNEEGGKLYAAALDAFSVPENQRGVPFLTLDDTYLIGSDAIGADLPKLIDEHLALGGTDWPPIPGLEGALQKAGFTRTPSTPWEKFLADQPANSLAVVVLAFLFLSLVFSILITFRSTPNFISSIPGWVFPVLLAIGLAVASYLTYTETTQSEVFCGGISHCTAVQESQYSKILGVVSIGGFGVLGYCCLGLALLVERVTSGSPRTIASITKFGFAVFGVSFSLYLTFLEPFVIGATCLWCLTSAAIMGLVLPLTTPPVQQAIQPGPRPAFGG